MDRECSHAQGQGIIDVVAAPRPVERPCYWVALEVQARVVLGVAVTPARVTNRLLIPPIVGVIEAAEIIGRPRGRKIVVRRRARVIKLPKAVGEKAVLFEELWHGDPGRADVPERAHKIPDFRCIRAPPAHERVSTRAAHSHLAVGSLE